MLLFRTLFRVRFFCVENKDMTLLKYLLLLLPLLLTGCGGEQAEVEEKERGYGRIIYLGPTITQNIFLLERQDLLVGVSSYCRHLPEAAAKEVAGDLVNPSIEQVMKLYPDVVMVTGMISPGAVERMKSFGIDVVLFPEPESFEEICSQFKELAGLLGEEEKARGIISSVKEEIQALREKAAAMPAKSVISQIGADPLWVSPKNSFINDIIEFAGGVNLGPDKGGRVSLERVIRENPDVILIIDMGIAEEQKRIWANYPAVNAVKNGRIYLVDSYIYCSPTPVIFTEAVRRTVELLHEK